MARSCSENNHNFEDHGDSTVCTICGDIKKDSDVNLQYEAEVNFKQDGPTNKNVNNWNRKSARLKNNVNSNTQDYHVIFEDRLKILCPLVGYRSFEDTSRALYYHTYSKWKAIRKHIVDQVIAALFYISSKKSDKGMGLPEIVDKLKLKLETVDPTPKIGVLATRILVETQTKLDTLPPDGFLDRGIILFKDFFKDYKEKDCEQIKELALDIVTFARHSGIFEGKNLVAGYCSCLYLAICHKVSIEFLRPEEDGAHNDIVVAGTVVSTIDELNRISGSRAFGNSKSTGTKGSKKKESANDLVQNRVKPFLTKYLKDVKAPSMATNKRIKELELYLTSRIKTMNNKMYQELITPQNFFQWVPMIIDDCFSSIKFDDYVTKSSGGLEQYVNTTTTTTSNDEETEDQTESPSKKSKTSSENSDFVENISFDYKKYKNTTTAIIVNDENTNFIQKDQTPVKLKKVPKTNQFKEEKKRSRADFEAAILSQCSSPPCPTVIKSMYKDTVKKARLISIKMKLVKKGELKEDTISNKDKEHYERFKTFVLKCKSFDNEYEHLLKLGVPDSAILEGSISLDSIKTNNQVIIAGTKDLGREELDDDDLCDEELKRYLRSQEEKKYREEVQQFIEDQEEKDKFVEVTEKDFF